MLSSEALVYPPTHGGISGLSSNPNCDLEILAQLQQAVNQSYLDEYYECLKKGKLTWKYL